MISLFAEHLPTRYTCRLTVRVECSAPGCDAFDEIQWWVLGGTIPEIGLPRGWSTLLTAPVCPEHAARLTETLQTTKENP
jgi:hypothetical protein